MTSLRVLFLSATIAALTACGASGDPNPAPVDFPDTTPDTTADTYVPPDTSIDDTGTDVSPDVAEETDTAPSSCGNKKVDTGEECDDGNNNNGDGCSSTCTWEKAVENDICPGTVIALTGTGSDPRKGSVSGTTVTALNHYSSSCGGGSGKDVVYTFTPPQNGTATVKFTAAYDAILAIRSTCSDSTTELACLEPTAGTVTKTFPVFKDTPVSLIVDGYAGASGTFTIDVEVNVASCGNGVAEIPEACDDGNTTDGDGCSKTCTLESGGILDACPGQPFKLKGTGTAPRKLSLAGDTSKATASSTGSSGCFYWEAKNLVYAIQADVAGSLHTDLLATYPFSNMHIRTECSSNTYQTFCDQKQAALAPIRADVPVAAGQWVYVFVDGGKKGTVEYGGPFTLDLTLTPASCGNDRLDGGEECDDGNTTTGDGCDASCKLEVPTDIAALNTCPGVPLTLTTSGSDRVARITGATTWTGLTNDHKRCGILADGPDVVYSITPGINGWATVKLQGNFTTVLGARATCVETETTTYGGYLACTNRADATVTPSDPTGLGYGPKEMSFAVTAGTPYYLIVDAWSSSGDPSKGVFELDVKVTPSVCGNGVVEGGEQCDDGAAEAGDGCSATCQLEPVIADTCTDAVEITLAESSGVWSGSKKSGTTNLASNIKLTGPGCAMDGRDAVFKVTAPMTGVLRAKISSSTFDTSLAAREVCATTGAAIACSNLSSGTGPEEIAFAVESGKTYFLVVDTPDTTSFGRFVLDVSVAASSCGDGVASGSEQCDDGNTATGDGCSATCTTETLALVDDCPGYAVALAGGGTAPRTATVSVDTRSLANNHSGVCGGNAAEGVLKVVPDISGTLRATIVSPTYAATIYARSTCSDPTTEFKKTTSSTCFNVDQYSVSTPATAGTPVYLFVDGLSGEKGVARVQITVTP